MTDNIPMPIKKQHFPVGMILILVLIGYGALGLLISLFRFQVSQLGPVVLSGSEALIMNLVIFAILATIFTGILMRRKWARILTIIYYPFSMALAVVNILSFMLNSSMYDELYGQMFSKQILAFLTPTMMMFTMVFTLIFSTAIGTVVLVYMLKRKDFFVK